MEKALSSLNRRIGSTRGYCMTRALYGFGVWTGDAPIELRIQNIAPPTNRMP